MGYRYLERSHRYPQFFAFLTTYVQPIHILVSVSFDGCSYGGWCIWRPLNDQKFGAYHGLPLFKSTMALFQNLLDEREVIKAGNMTFFWSAAMKFSSVWPKEPLKHDRVSISAEDFNRFKLVSISQQPSYCEPGRMGIICFNPWKNGIVKGIIPNMATTI